MLSYDIDFGVIQTEPDYFRSLKIWLILWNYA